MEDVDIDSNFFETYPSLQDSQPKNYYDSKEFNEMYVKFSDTKKNLNVLNLNVRSLTANGDTLVSYLETLRVNFDIICITETWQKVESLSPIYFPDYKLFGSFRANGLKGGGVAILVKSDYKCNIIDELTLNNDIIESVFIEVSLNSRNFIVGCCYRPHTFTNCNLFTNLLTEKLNNLNLKVKDCIVCGDFNIDLLKIENCSSIANFYDSMQALALLPVIHKPTRITDESFSLIDNIFTNKVSNFEAGILTFDVSDHFPNFLIFTEYFDSTPLIKEISYRLINEQTLEDLFLRLQDYDYEILLNHDCEVAL